MEELRPLEASEAEYVQALTRATKEVATTHVLDVLCTVEAGLRQLRWNIDPRHDGKVQPGGYTAVEQGRNLLVGLLKLLPAAIKIDYQDIAGQCDEDNLLLHDEYVVADTRAHVAELLSKLGTL